MAHPRYAQNGEGAHAPARAPLHVHDCRPPRASRLSAGALLPIPLGPEGQSIHEADRDAEEDDGAAAERHPDLPALHVLRLPVEEKARRDVARVERAVSTAERRW